MTANDRALVLGATGGIGGEVARSLLARGWNVCGLHRNPDTLSATNRALGLRWQRGDALSRADVTAAAPGVSVIVHAVNPPGYRNWAKLVLPMLEATIAGAKASGARIILPGAVYNFGPDAWPVLREDSPQNPITRKGAIRVEMERRLRQAAGEGVRVLIVRAGDYFGPHQTGNAWLSAAMIKPGKPVTSVLYPGRKGVGHQWAYLPDVAETMARLVENEDRLAAFESFHVDGHWDPDGTAFVSAIGHACGKPDIRVRSFPWRAVALASPFVPVFREITEVRYLWREPLRLDNSRLVAFLGQEPRTPLYEAVRMTLQGLGCLP